MVQLSTPLSFLKLQKINKEMEFGVIQLQKSSSWWNNCSRPCKETVPHP